ncbi:MAG: hypothetical protein Q7I93_01340, partial [Syntrophales bacterium]|nr:hypothetical protein [Syntrophales bacterium]
SKSNAAYGAKTGRHGEPLSLSLTPGKFFPATQACRKLTTFGEFMSKRKCLEEYDRIATIL